MNAVSQLTDMILRLARSPIMCSLDMPVPPPGQQVDPERINVRFTPAGDAPEIIGYIGSASECATRGGGWYYEYGDGPTASPTGIKICESTCSFFGGGVVEILLGCPRYDLG